MKIRIVSVLIVLWLASFLPARNWSVPSANEVEAEIVSATDTNVTIVRKSDGRQFTLPLEKLSEAEREWIASQTE